MRGALIVLASVALAGCRGERAPGKAPADDAAPVVTGPPSRIVDPTPLPAAPRPQLPRRMSEQLLDAGKGARRALRYRFEPTSRTTVASASIQSQECQKWLSEVIETFQRSGLLNDELYATGAIRSLRQRGLSTRAIEAKMTIKGVPAALIKRTLQEIDDLTENDPNLVAAVKQARKRRIGPYWPSDKEGAPGLRDKHLARMARAGFDFETAHKVLKMDKEEADNLIGSSGW